MNRRELFHRSLIGAAGAAVAPALRAREFPASQDASRELANPDWKPVFLSDHQNATLIAFADLLIPETNTLGAKAALVNRFIDLLLSSEARDVQQAFMDDLAFLDGASFEQYRRAFVFLTPEEKAKAVAFMAYPHDLVTWQDNSQGQYRGHEHFENLKGWVTRSFYSSEAGMKELGYDGPPHGIFTGCDHPEGH